MKISGYLPKVSLICTALSIPLAARSVTTIMPARQDTFTKTQVPAKGTEDKSVLFGAPSAKLNIMGEEKFAKIAIKEGVPKENIYIEKKSTNTGDNFRFSKELIERERLQVKSCIVVCKPYDEKRVYAAFKKIIPEYELIIHSENISCEEYYKKNGKEWIDVLVGDIQRMKLFYEKGWQIKMEIPDNVWNAYEILAKKGYDKYIFKNPEDKGAKKDIEEKLKLLDNTSKK